MRREAAWLRLTQKTSIQIKKYFNIALILGVEA
jgi:hypothetical protein